MKVRIQGNSFRFRLKQPELAQFTGEGRIEEKVTFGADSCLSFAMQVTESNDFRVAFQRGEVVFHVPAAITFKWASTDQVGFEAAVDTGQARTISLLVEKDFRCMEACAADNEGSYEQPFH